MTYKLGWEGELELTPEQDKELMSGITSAINCLLEGSVTREQAIGALSYEFRRFAEDLLDLEYNDIGNDL